MGNPVAIASESVSNALKVALVTLPAAVVEAALVSPWMLAELAVPLLFILAPELRLRDQVARR